MIISVEISYYPLTDEYLVAVHTFIQRILDAHASVEVGKMSSIVTGEHEVIMRVLTDAMGELMKKYASVFTLKISNSCPV